MRACLCLCALRFEFSLQDVNSATAVHQNLQGAVIPSSGRGGMRIQYPFCMLNIVVSLGALHMKKEINCQISQKLNVYFAFLLPKLIDICWFKKLVGF